MMSGIHMNNTSFTTNGNATDVINCGLSPEPRESYLFRAIALFCIMLISLVGNVLVCRGAIRRRQRPFSYHLVTNLAVAELVFTSTQPFQFIYNTKPYSWVFGDFLCHVIYPLTLCTTLVITFTLASIAVYRCVMMLQPYRYRPSARAAYTVITFSWIWGIVLAMPDSITRKILDAKDCGVFYCINYRHEELSDYRMAMFVVNFVVPFITMVASYSLVVCRVKKHIANTRQDSVIVSESLGTRSSVLGSDTKHQPEEGNLVMKELRIPGKNESPPPIQNLLLDSKKKKVSSKMMRLEADVLNMIYLILVVFFVCYLPSNVFFVLTEVLALRSVKMWPYRWLMMWYVNLLHVVPSALHPICYGATSSLLGRSPRCLGRRRRFTVK